MNLKFRLICYAVVALVIPLLIWLVYKDFPIDSIKWIGYCLLILGGYELGLAIQKRRGN